MSEKREVHRSAETGRFVTEDEAEANPAQTDRETVVVKTSADAEALYNDLAEALAETTDVRTIARLLLARGWRKT